MPSRILPVVLGIFHGISGFDNFIKVVETQNFALFLGSWSNFKSSQIFLFQVVVQIFIRWNGFERRYPSAYAGLKTTFEALVFDDHIKDQLPCWYM